MGGTVQYAELLNLLLLLYSKDTGYLIQVRITGVSQSVSFEIEVTIHENVQ